MAACSSWQTEEERPDHAVIRRPGERPAADDLREILLYLVETVAGVDLRRCSKLTYLDDMLSYEEMAKNAADLAFVKPEIDPMALDVAQSIFEGEIAKYLLAATNFDFTAYTTKYAYAIIVNPLLKKRPVTCVKRIYATVERIAKMIACRQDLTAYMKDDLCEHLVEGIHLAVEMFEEEYENQPMDCYVNIWEIDYTLHGGLEHLKPAVQTPQPPGQDIPGAGAELMKHMLHTMTGIPISQCFGTPQLQGDLCVLKGIVESLVEADWKENPVTADSAAEKAMLDIYKETLKDLRSASQAGVTKKHQMHYMSLQFKGVFVTHVLSKIHLERYQAWAGFFILISRVIKVIQQQPNALLDEDVLTSFCDAMYSAMNTHRVRDIAQSDPSLWLNFESNHGHLLNW